jgi:penicillin amidase
MKNNIQIWRDQNGIPHVEAETLNDLYWGQGYVHGIDRGLQMALMRILGQGRACELLDSSDETLGIDTFFRKMNWHGHVREQEEKLSPDTKSCLDSYSDGVSAAMEKRFPWELKMIGCRYEAWRAEDSIMMTRMLGYLTLAQSQAETERLFVEMVQAGVENKKLEELFPGILEGFDRELIQKMCLNERVVPTRLLWNLAVPRMMASNNWVISGKKTASGKPLLSNDPHLETNRLPNVWSEIVLACGDRYAMGGSMPGFPGILTGRTGDVAWGVTYAFMDSVDSWVERCRDGKFYREAGEEWVPFSVRKETILRKKKEPVDIIFHENLHGVLDGDPDKEGSYLATCWAPTRSGAQSIESILGMWDMKTTEEAMDLLGQAETAWNFVIADKKGDIGYQMSGLMPKRREGVSGFVPLPGWDEKNDWNGFVGHRDLPRVINPDKGFFATANDDLNRYGKVSPINMPMGSYRADRINDLLNREKPWSPEDMFQMHFDCYSIQAEKFMKILKPLLPQTEQGTILARWDFCYDRDSKGAFLFEAFYAALYGEVFGENGFGEETCDFLQKETGFFIDFYRNFDRILLSEDSCWFGNESREEIYRKLAAKALDIPIRSWGDTRQFVMKHILFGGKLPRFLGFDRGPIVGIGSRATIHQGQIYRSEGRDTTFMPSYRIVSDLATEECRTNLAGGPTDRRFSRWYISDLKNWMTGKYKTLTVHGDGKKQRFP